MKRQQPEHTLQKAIVEYLRLRRFWPIAVPNGTQIAGNDKQRAMRVALLKQAGMTPGFPDLIVFGPQGRVGTIEVKAEGAYQQPAQKECQHRLAELGHHYAVCRSLEDVEDTLVAWGWVSQLIHRGEKLRPVPPYISDDAEAA